MKHEKVKSDSEAVTDCTGMTRKDFLKAIGLGFVGVGLGAVSVTQLLAEENRAIRGSSEQLKLSPNVGLQKRGASTSNRLQGMVRRLVSDEDLAQQFLKDPNSVLKKNRIRMNSQQIQVIQGGLRDKLAGRRGAINLMDKQEQVQVHVSISW